MDEISRYAVNLPTSAQHFGFEAVVASVMKDGRLNMIGSAEVPNSGRCGGGGGELGRTGAGDDRVLGS